MEDRYQIRRAQVDDIPNLSKLHQRTFQETFVEDFGIPYPEEDLQEYYRTSSSEEYFREKISDSRRFILVIEDQSNGDLLGYSLCGPCEDLPHDDVKIDEDGQLSRIYIRRDFQNHKFGQRLMKENIQWFDENYPSKTIWLSVWSKNFKAQRFYSHYGFSYHGEFLLPIGNWYDEEFLMKRSPTSN